MKKFYVILSVARVVALTAVLAYAASTTFQGELQLSDPNTSPTTIKIHTSTNVTMTIISDAGAYAIQTDHFNGDRQFGVTWDSVAIYWNSKTPGQTVTAITASDSSAFASWLTL